ncbi:MAG: MXAN_6640 family putative metalloprotease [Bacteroidota bacterium]
MIKVFENKHIYYRFVVLLLLSVSISAIAQELHQSTRLKTEQLLQYYRALKDSSHKVLMTDEMHGGKCGLGINAAIHSQWNNFTGLQKIELKKLLAVASFQKDRVIGKFHIYYDITGPNEPALLDASNQRISNTAEAYIDSVGKIFNDVYHVEIDTLGYVAPPFESGETHYRILVSDMSNYSYGTYGSTNWDESLPPLNSDGYAPRYPCFVELHNDFSAFYTKGINALKVTAAHEFHHVIQVGSYGYRSNDLFAHELTSTWMEDVVYTNVNDYYQYLPNYFNLFSVGLSFNYYRSFDFRYDGYERCIWAHYLAKRFSLSIMRDVWTRMRTQTFLESTDATLVNIGSNLQTAFAEFTYWNYFTANRADTMKYYSEGNHYPRFEPLQQRSFQNTTDSIGGDVYPLSSSMYEFDLPSDTITSMISNVEVGAAEQRDLTTRRVDVTLSADVPLPPYQEFTNYGLIAKVIVADTSLWRSFFSQGVRHDTVINPPRFVVSSDASPNPFRLMGSQQLLLPIQDVAARTAEVYFYSSSLNLAYSGQLPVSIKGLNRVIVVLASEVKSKLSSGIYFVIAKTVNNEYKWKVAVIR